MEYKLVKRYVVDRRDWEYHIYADSVAGALPQIAMPKEPNETDIMFKQRAIAVFDEFIKERRFIASQHDEIVKTEVV